MITLASDFGSPYPAAMKGVILRRTGARLVDVAHDLPRGDVRAAAFWLRFVLPEFPPAVHLAVVDPGVGTGRAALVVRAGEHVLVGPDNGMLLPAARALAAGDDGSTGTGAVGSAGSGAGAGAPASAGATGADADRSGPEAGGRDASGARLTCYTVEYDDPDSATFHGRDVFAPAAATAHRAVADGSVVGSAPGSADVDAGAGTGSGWTPDALDDVEGFVPAEAAVDCRFPDPVVEADRALAEVLVVDGFGNAVTNLPGEVLAAHEAVVVDGERVPVAETFAAVDPGGALATVGSHGNVELDVNDGRGDERFGLAPGDAVELRFVD